MHGHAERVGDEDACSVSVVVMSARAAYVHYRGRSCRWRLRRHGHHMWRRAGVLVRVTGAQRQAGRQAVLTPEGAADSIRQHCYIALVHLTAGHSLRPE